MLRHANRRAPQPQTGVVELVRRPADVNSLRVGASAGGEEQERARDGDGGEGATGPAGGEQIRGVHDASLVPPSVTSI